jgi:hypothetical protein
VNSSDDSAFLGCAEPHAYHVADALVEIELRDVFVVREGRSAEHPHAESLSG